MFERYTEAARRVMFYARYECSQSQSPAIESWHLLLGMAYKGCGSVESAHDKNPLSQFFETDTQHLRQIIEVLTEDRIKDPSPSVDIPLSDEVVRILRRAADEADKLSSKSIRTGHILLGILREENSLAANVLLRFGVQVDAIRKKMAHSLAPR